jgi:hypothetical protein
MILESTAIVTVWPTFPNSLYYKCMHMHGQHTEEATYWYLRGGGLGFIREVIFRYWFFIKYFYIIHYCQRLECWSTGLWIYYVTMDVVTSVGSARRPSLLNFMLMLFPHTSPMWSLLFRFTHKNLVPVVLNYNECLFRASACLSVFDICHHCRFQKTRWTKE